MRLLERSSAVVVLQARTGSQRLPGKALHLIAGRPLIVHCLERLRAADVGQVVLATTTSRADDRLAALALDSGLPVVRASEADVLGRFALAARRFPADVVIRATGDNPAVDIGSPERVLDALTASAADYVVESGLPYGSTVEAVRRDVLLQAAHAARAPSDREHVTTWITRQPGRFRVRLETAPRALHRPDLRFTVDTALDLEYMRRVIRGAGGPVGFAPLGELIAVADRLVEAEVA